MRADEFYSFTEQFPTEYAAASTFAEFAALLDGSKPGPGRLLQHIAEKYPNHWEAYFRTIKAHGRFMGRSLLLPEAKTVRDVFASVSLFPYETGHNRGDAQYTRAGAAFVSTNRAPGFAFFGHLGATYDWSPDWLARGEHIRRVRGGQNWLTGAVPVQAIVNAYGAPCGPDEWDIATFEAIKWDDGRILLTMRAQNGFGETWVAVLNEGETALSLLDDHERGEIEAEHAQQRAAWGE